MAQGGLDPATDLSQWGGQGMCDQSQSAGRWSIPALIITLGTRVKRPGNQDLLLRMVALLLFQSNCCTTQKVEWSLHVGSGKGIELGRGFESPLSPLHVFIIFISFTTHVACTFVLMLFLIFLMQNIM